MDAAPHVGTLREKHLHAALKRWYAEDGDLVEQPVDGFVVDLVRDGRLVEIQTRGFSGMRRKLEALLDQHAVHVVHPIAVERVLVKVEDTGEVRSRRRSPKRGTAVDVFGELASFPGLVAHPRFSLEVALTREEEVRRFEAGKAWRRHGWVTQERRLVEVVDTVRIDEPDDLAALLPDDLPPEFTTADLAAALRRPRRLAQQMAYCLRRLGLVEEVRRDRSGVVYARPAATRSGG